MFPLEGPLLITSARKNEIEQPVSKPTYRQTLDEIITRLNTDRVRGLRFDQIEELLQCYGPNQLHAQDAAPAWRSFLAQFHSSLVVLLLVAASTSTAVWFYERDTPAPYEALAIFSIVLLNAGLSYLQASRAERAIAVLGGMSAAKACVVRNGESSMVAAGDLVPGDLILIQEGDKIAADARLLDSAALETAEAMLTGESSPVSKKAAEIGAEVAIGDRYNMVFSGTLVVQGRGSAIVVSTGMRTELGQIAALLEGVQSEQTPLQLELERTGKVLGTVVIAIAVAITSTVILVEHVRSVDGLVEVFLFGVALAVAAAPEGLPAIITMILSAGVQRMARKRALVRHLVAVETLGSANVIASDKTGTLTKNEMTVREVLTASGFITIPADEGGPDVTKSPDSLPTMEVEERVELEQALTVAELANDASAHLTKEGWVITGDPTEGALLIAASKAGIRRDVLSARFPRAHEIPFSSERKLMSTVHLDSFSEKTTVFCKGAPDVLMAKCVSEFKAGEIVELTEDRRRQITNSTESLARQGRRTIGVAFRVLPKDSFAGPPSDERIERDLVFAGIIGILDPPRPEAKDAVARAGSRCAPDHDHWGPSRLRSRNCRGSRDHGQRTGIDRLGNADNARRRAS